MFMMSLKKKTEKNISQKFSENIFEEKGEILLNLADELIKKPRKIWAK